jgi:hypothetical protein
LLLEGDSLDWGFNKGAKQYLNWQQQSEGLCEVFLSITSWQSIRSMRSKSASTLVDVDTRSDNGVHRRGAYLMIKGSLLAVEQRLSLFRCLYLLCYFCAFGFCEPKDNSNNNNNNK